MRSIFALTMVMGAVLLHGCGGSDSVPLGFVTGTVTLDGVPVPGAMVVYNVGITDPKTSVTVNLGASAVTDDKGFYELKYLGQVAGVPAGEASVQIDPASWDVRPLEGSAAPPPSDWPKKIARKYFAPFKNLTIKAGEKQVVDLPLTSK